MLRPLCPHAAPALLLVLATGCDNGAAPGDAAPGGAADASSSTTGDGGVDASTPTGETDSDVASACAGLVDEPFEVASSPDEPPPGWKIDPTNYEGTVQVTDDLPGGAHSDPLSLLAEVDFAKANATTGRASISQTKALERPSRVVVRYVVRVEQANVALDIGCTPWIEASAINDYSSERIRLHLDEGELSLEVSRSDSTPVGALELGTWYEIHLALGFGATAMSAEVDVAPLEGGDTASAQLVGIDAPSNLDELRLSCGIPYAVHSVGGATVVVDDIEVELCPEG